MQVFSRQSGFRALWPPHRLPSRGHTGAEQLKVSGVHLTFNTEEEWAGLAAQGFLQRTGIPVPLVGPLALAGVGTRW